MPRDARPERRPPGDEQQRGQERDLGEQGRDDADGADRAKTVQRGGLRGQQADRGAGDRAGARSYLTKDADRADIAQAIRSAVTGLSVRDPAVQAALLAAATAQASKPPEQRLPQHLPGGLTQREAEILCMMARGMTNPDIAAKLYLSSHTIKSHINRIFAKTGSADRAAAVRYAREHGLG